MGPGKTDPRPGESDRHPSDENAILDELRAFAEDHLWIEENRRRLLEQYDGQWIAVRNRNVIANAPALDVLISKLDDPPRTCVEFITSERLEMIL
jgi:hypothetical protein